MAAFAEVTDGPEVLRDGQANRGGLPQLGVTGGMSGSYLLDRAAKPGFGRRRATRAMSGEAGGDQKVCSGRRAGCSGRAEETKGVKATEGRRSRR